MGYIMNEWEIAIKFLFLGMAKSVIQLDLKNIQNGPFKIKDLYIDQLERMHTMATNERRKLNKIMWDKRISIIFIEKDTTMSRYKLIYNGREEIIFYNSYSIRKHVKEILVEMSSDVNMLFLSNSSKALFIVGFNNSANSSFTARTSFKSSMKGTPYA